jgi:LysM repeat protein
MYVQEGYIIHIGQQVTVRSGDTLDKLAARFGTTLRQVSFLFVNKRQKKKDEKETGEKNLLPAPAPRPPCSPFFHVRRERERGGGGE